MHLHLALPLLSVTVLLFSANAWSPRGQPAECALSLISLSPCLTYISAAPNYSPELAPSPLCCGAFSQSIAYGGASCMCFLVRDPLILGFPVDAGRVVSLFSSCGTNGSVSAASWFYDICLEMETLSALPSIGPNSDMLNSSSADALWTVEGPVANPPHSNAPVQMDQFLRKIVMIWLMIFVFLIQ